MEEIEKKYVLWDQKEIKKFLKDKPDLISVLLLISENVGKYFKFSYLTLSHIKFYEEEWLEVEIIMQKDVSVDKGLEQLEKFDNEFLLEIKQDISQIIVDVKFV